MDWLRICLELKDENYSGEKNRRMVGLGISRENFLFFEFSLKIFCFVGLKIF